MIVATLFLCLLPASAGAQGGRKEATALLREGARLYEKGDKAGALSKFIKAFNRYPSYKIEYNIAVLLDELKRHTEAAAYFERFVTTKGNTAPANMMGRAHIKLAVLMKRLASVQVSCPVRGAWLLVNGREVAQLPLGYRTYLEPGTYRITVKEQGYAPFEKKLTLRAGDHKNLLAALKRTAVSPPVEADEPRPPPTLSGKQQKDPFDIQQPRQVVSRERPLYKRWWFWTIVGAVVVGATVGGTVAAVNQDSNELPDGDFRWSLIP